MHPPGLHLLAALGRWLSGSLAALGSGVPPLASTASAALTLRIPPRALFGQLHLLIVRSLLFIGVGTFCIGLVFAMSLGHVLAPFNIEIRTVGVLTAATVQTLGPIFTGLLLAGRVASGLAAEIGAMQRTDQLAAMRALSIDIHSALIAPRVLAVTIGSVVLTMLADALMLLGGLVVMVAQFDMLPATFFGRVALELRPGDLLSSFAKALVFGVLIGAIGCAAGLRSKRRTADVGEHTKAAVVAASFTILLANVILTRLFLVIYP